nr:DEAD/DEAH box helicase [Desulfuromonadales bacterium]
MLAAEAEVAERSMQQSGSLHAAREDLFLGPQQMAEAIDPARRIDFATLELYRPGEQRENYRFRALGNGDLRRDTDSEHSVIETLGAKLAEWKSAQWRVLIVCHQRSQADRLLDLLAPFAACPTFVPDGEIMTLRPGAPQLVLGDLSAGFRLLDEKLAIITEEEIFGRARRRRSDTARAKAALSSLAQLKEGDFIVHTDHGIGRYRGLHHLKMGQVEGDFLHLEYAAGDKLYLPVERITRVQKYVGGEGHVPRLDKMGGTAWEKTKLRARAAAEEMARDLLKIQAKRDMRQGHPYAKPDRMFREFEASFAYEETPDQLAAIEQVIDDMISERPMDRLVCGDVGYGKTEVAIRAAFKAVQDGKQVAVLVPTTVLARQHWETFCQRFADYPVNVEMVSRLRSVAQQKEIFARLKEGQVDILVGTHRLLQRDVRFKDLGLIIIDEEQRFGVTHKERLKQLRAEVDVLTLTATPIPRTLHMSLMGLRELSVIETPPV